MSRVAKPGFALLALHSGNYTQEIICVWAFDPMKLNGEDLRPVPLVARKRKLDVVIVSGPMLDTKPATGNAGASSRWAPATEV